MPPAVAVRALWRTGACLSTYASVSGPPFPQSPQAQLAQAIGAVLRSWQSTKAREYRRVNALPNELGTAVTVQTMVFGNAGGQSGAGVGFTRDPATGKTRLWVDFLFNAQGKDVVSGRRSALDHDKMDQITLDGNEGTIYPGAANTVVKAPVELLSKLAKLGHV